MKIKSSRFLKGCEKRLRYDNIASGDHPSMLELHNTIKEVCVALAKRSGEEYHIIKKLRFTKEKDEPTQVWATREEEYRQYLLRFVNWLHDAYPPETVYSIPGNAEYILPDPIMLGNECVDTIYDTPSLIIEVPGKPAEIMYIFRKQESHSDNARKEENKVANYLPLLLAKLCYLNVYKCCTVSYVSLKTSRDNKSAVGDTAPFVVSKNKTSNYHMVAYESELKLVEEEELRAELSARIQTITASGTCETCYSCPHKRLCSVDGAGLLEISDTVSSSGVDSGNPKTSGMRMPDFTERQRKAVVHQNGALLILAGPGSGKTAVLVGRTVNLVQYGIEPENILLITFTNKAVDELRERVGRYMPAGRTPKICTINSICYEIVQQNAREIFGRKIKVKVLTPLDQKRIVYEMLETHPKMSNLNYDYLIGNNGLINKVVNALEQLEKFRQDPKAMEQVLSSLNLGKDFLPFAERYWAFCENAGYVTFAQQITKCADFLESNEKLLKIYQNIYRYIMVDEYQDIDYEQYRFISILGAHGNIAVAGDDDQTIYAFRNASSEFIQKFSTDEVEVVKLTENFRCTREIVTAANQVISMVGGRIEKEIISHKEGVRPRFYTNQTVEKLLALIKSKVASGYRYGDIVILGRKNEELSKLHKLLKHEVPCYLAKIRLVDDGVCGFLYCILHLFYEGVHDNATFMRYLSYLGVTPENLPFDTYSHQNNSLYDQILKSDDRYEKALERKSCDDALNDDFLFGVLQLLMECFDLLFQNVSAKRFVTEVVESLGIEEGASIPAIMELIDEMGEGVSTAAFHERLDMMNRFNDEHTYETKHENAIALYTTHSAKGKEFPIVIMIGCESYSADNAEDLRLAYVGMTRAEQELHIFAENGRNCTLRAFIDTKVDVV